MRRSKALRFFDFSGGLNTKAPATSLKMNQAMDLQNINLIGAAPMCGFEKRRGNTVFNSSALASGSAVHGMGYYRQADGDEWLMAIAGTVIAASSSLSGTLSDITGAVTITTGANNTWTHSVMNDISIWVGGAPDAPIKWAGSGNAAALAGSPPSGSFGLTANNRFFIGNTAANPSRIAWSILGNPEDWSASGSGTQDVSTSDNDTLVGGAQLGADHLILFKQNSIHDLIVRSSPFPLFPVRRGANIGAVSKRGIVPVDNLIYYVTPEPRMKATDGSQVIDFPDTLDTTWDGLNKSRLQHIRGIYYPKLRQIHWLCSDGSATTHDLSIIWDLDHKCWLQNPTGFKMNDAVLAQDRLLYTGGYDGKLYKQDVASTYTDASETSPGAIDASWRSGWMDIETMLQTKIPLYADLNFKTQATGTFDFSYGFNFNADRVTETLSMVAPGDKWGEFLWGIGMWGGQTDMTRLVHMKGNGKYFQHRLRNKNASEAFYFNGLEMPIKIGASEALSVA